MKDRILIGNEETNDELRKVLNHKVGGDKCKYVSPDGEICGRILKTSNYRHSVLAGEPIDMLNHPFQAG